MVLPDQTTRQEGLIDRLSRLLKEDDSITSGLTPSR